MPKVEREPKRTDLEAHVQAEVRAALSAMPDVTVWRNNVGTIWASPDEIARWGIPPGLVSRVSAGIQKKWRSLKYGLCEGSADLVGFVRVLADGLTMGQYGQYSAVARVRVPRFLALEVKRPGAHPTPEQVAWLEYVRRQGGVAGVVHSAAEAVDLIEEARAWRI
jgi:hypothetical protein